MHGNKDTNKKKSWILKTVVQSAIFYDAEVNLKQPECDYISKIVLKYYIEVHNCENGC